MFGLYFLRLFFLIFEWTYDCLSVVFPKVLRYSVFFFCILPINQLFIIMHPANLERAPFRWKMNSNFGWTKIIFWILIYKILCFLRVQVKNSETKGTKNAILSIDVHLISCGSFVTQTWIYIQYSNATFSIRSCFFVFFLCNCTYILTSNSTKLIEIRK